MRGLCATAAFALVLAGAADARIRVGEEIGGVRLGMTRAQVERVLGKPLGIEQVKGSFGARSLVLHFGYGAYDVELRGRGEPRVVRIVTGLRSERTPEGIGVGSNEVELLKTLKPSCSPPRQRLTSRGAFFGYLPRSCSLRSGRAETTFSVRQRRRFGGVDRWVSRTAEVYEISIRAL